MPDTEQTARIVQSVTDSVATLRKDLLARMDSSDAEHRAANAKVAESLHGFMLQQAQLNPQLASRERVEAVSEHMHRAASQITAHEVRLTKLEQRSEKLSGQIAEQMAELLRGQGDLRNSLEKHAGFLLTTEDRRFLDEGIAARTQRAEDRRDRSRSWHDALSKAVVTLFLGGGFVGGVIEFAVTHLSGHP